MCARAGEPIVCRVAPRRCVHGPAAGELDALRRVNVDLARSRIRVVEQLSAMARTFTLPKNDQTREAPLTEPAREAILSLPVEGEFCFAPIRGSHWTASARAYHWKAVRGAAGWEGSIYIATRHFAGWYMVNVLELPSADVAIALGHTDGGELVRKLYGHRDRERALDRVTAMSGRPATRRCALSSYLSAFGGQEQDAPQTPRIYRPN
jgi:hypothetical protein